jgi:RNA polymerase sigma-70 factor (TIGR02957 family)
MIDHTQDADRSEVASVFDEHRGLLVSVAYRVLGSVTDAEDAVQEAWIRWSGVDHSEVADPLAFLVRVTTRLAIDRLRRAKVRRESYVGPWLPEPILTRQDPAEDAAMAESVSMAMLVVLETLSPLERAVFVLREAFGMPHAEIADVLGRREEAVRQLARRAREHVRERRTRFDADRTEQRRVTERFLEATTDGDLEALMEVLSSGVTLVADGGGRALAPRRPVRGAHKVAQFLVAIVDEEQTARFLKSVGFEPSSQLSVHLAQVNGETGVVITAGDEPISALVMDVSEGLVRTIRLVANGRRPGSRAASMKGSRGLEARLRKMSPRTHRRREELPQRPPRPGGLNTDGRRSSTVRYRGRECRRI